MRPKIIEAIEQFQFSASLNFPTVEKRVINTENNELIGPVLPEKAEKVAKFKKMRRKILKIENLK